MMPLLTIGPLRLSTYGIAVLAMTALWWWWGERRIRAATQRDADTLLFLMLVGAWLGGRLWYVAMSPAIVAQLSNWRALEFAWPGACVGAFIVLMVMARRAAWQPRQVLALLAVPTLVAQAGGAVGMYVAGMGMGSAWDGWWAVDMAGMLRHPTQLYEAGVALLGALACGLLVQRRPEAGALGLLGALATNWLVVEGFRAHASILPGGIHLAQLIGLFVLVVVTERIIVAGTQVRE